MPVPRRLLAAITATLAVSAVAAVPAGAATGARGAERRVAAPDGLSPAKRLAPRRATARRASTTTADPRLPEQWAVAGDDAMGARSAWRQTTGGEVTVAVVDSGVDLGHPDLAANLWRNPGEVPDNGVDDDRNGVVDDVHGVDLVDRDGDPADANGHGTHVAGIIAARGNNGIGVAGVAWRARIMAVRVLDDRAAGSTATVAAGIRYAVANGARIVNLSLAGPGRSSELEAAIADAGARGVLVVAAAGNGGQDLAATPSYPASFPEENLLGVAATAPGGGLTRISAYGPGVDVAAPGEDVLSTAVGGAYEWRTGTSMAAPHVAGTLALLAAARPDLDWRGLRDAVLAGARPTDLPVGAGLLDAAGALRRALPAGAWVGDPAAAADVAAPVASRKAAVKPRASRAKARGKTLRRKRAAMKRRVQTRRASAGRRR